MRISITLLISLLNFTNIFAQEMISKVDSWRTTYRATHKKINDLVHTKLEVKFDYARTYMYGKAWITLKPHFYPTDSLLLDAKGMSIKSVAIQKANTNENLKYEYDGMELHIHLDKTYKNFENYTIYISYTAKPDEVKMRGSLAINEAKGLYFVNPYGEEKYKPIQIWTQGETESNSVWFPTIDKPNQKTTEEISMTVPRKYVTLSNGKLMSQKENPDSTRTDYWKMDLPHAPYLFFMGVGDYAIVKDKYKDKDVLYYVEKDYAYQAKRVFGETPAMMDFFSRITGVEYPWPKYAQIVARDYVSGAMENTSATLLDASIQWGRLRTIDNSSSEATIAHELFHQWFGDLVTCESWSNLALNEAFATLGEILWTEYADGKDAGDAVSFEKASHYLSNPENAKKNLIQFYYRDKEDVLDFDIIYCKGSQVLSMLRSYVGDSAFFKSLNLYLNTYKFKTADANCLRLSFEEVTGLDLNWFWNQWFFGSGHPKLAIDYAYDEKSKNVQVIIKQTQDGEKIFKLPIAIDIYNDSIKVRHKVWVQSKSDTFNFHYLSKPDLINVDGDKTLLCEKIDNKTVDNFVHQYKYARSYLDRKEAIEYCYQNQHVTKAKELLKIALNDPYPGLKQEAIDLLK